jgi:ArsR family transcriptional regulator, arsenate/arsenite/antimonite-responsive transcriptional repressor
MTTRSLRDTVDAVKALGHPARLRILCLLRQGELCVCQITEVLGFAPSTVSEHLAILRRSGFIEERKESKWVFYALADDPEDMALCSALWSVLEGDKDLKADVLHCAKVRKMPLSALCKSAGKPLQLIGSTPSKRR